MKKYILHLYYDLLNLYGENGNVKALKYSLGDNYTIDYLTIGDEINFDKYDFIYIGMGTEKNMHIALEDLLKRKDKIKFYIEHNGIVLSTGNSFEMFGKYIEYHKEKINALNLFDYYTVDTTERVVHESSYKTDILKKTIIGFENRGSETRGNTNFLGHGYNYKNFYGTYLVGPILVRNPELLKYFVFKLTGEHKKLNLEFEEKAYNKKVLN